MMPKTKLFARERQKPRDNGEGSIKCGGAVEIDRVQTLCEVESVLIVASSRR